MKIIQSFILLFTNKEYRKVWIIAAITLTLIILALVGYEYLSSDKPVYASNAYGGQNIRVKKEDGNVNLPKELPEDFAPIYPEVRLEDIWVDTDSNNKIINIDIITYSKDDKEKIIKYYEEKLETSAIGDTISGTYSNLKTTIFIEKKNDEGEYKVEIMMK